MILPPWQIGHVIEGNVGYSYFRGRCCTRDARLRMNCQLYSRARDRLPYCALTASTSLVDAPSTLHMGWRGGHVPGKAKSDFWRFTSKATGGSKGNTIHTTTPYRINHHGHTREPYFSDTIQYYSSHITTSLIQSQISTYSSFDRAREYEYEYDTTG